MILFIIHSEYRIIIVSEVFAGPAHDRCLSTSSVFIDLAPRPLIYKPRHESMLRQSWQNVRLAYLPTIERVFTYSCCNARMEYLQLICPRSMRVEANYQI